MFGKVFECDLCRNQIESYSSENKFYIDKDSFILICKDCLNKRKYTCCRCGSESNLVYIHYTNKSSYDTVCCEHHMYDVSDEIEYDHKGENIGTCQYCYYFPESALDNKSFMEHFHKLIEHQCH